MQFQAQLEWGRKFVPPGFEPAEVHILERGWVHRLVYRHADGRTWVVGVSRATGRVTAGAA